MWSSGEIGPDGAPLSPSAEPDGARCVRGGIRPAIPLVTIPIRHPAWRNSLNASRSAGRHDASSGIRRRYGSHNCSGGVTRSNVWQMVAKKPPIGPEW